MKSYDVCPLCGCASLSEIDFWADKIGTGDTIVDRDYLDKVMKKSSVNYSYGWICPRCGKVLAPDVKECTCKNNNIYRDSNVNDTSFNKGSRCVIPGNFRYCGNSVPSDTICYGCCNWLNVQ